MSKALKNIDIELLKQQKLSLLHVLDNVVLLDQTEKDLTGILNMLDTIQDEIEPIEIEEETIPLTYKYLITKLSWEKFCDITGVSYYALNDGYEIKSTEIFNIKESVAKEYNLI